MQEESEASSAIRTKACGAGGKAYLEGHVL